MKVLSPQRRPARVFSLESLPHEDGATHSTLSLVGSSHVLSLPPLAEPPLGGKPTAEGGVLSCLRSGGFRTARARDTRDHGVHLGICSVLAPGSGSASLLPFKNKTFS